MVGPPGWLLPITRGWVRPKEGERLRTALWGHRCSQLSGSEEGKAGAAQMEMVKLEMETMPGFSFQPSDRLDHLGK